MDHEKRHYRLDQDGRVAYAPDAKDGKVAGLQQRTAMGKHRDGSIYLRATDSDDLAKVKEAADALGIAYRQRRSGASHHGRVGSYEHLHFDHPQDALSVHAVLGYHLEEDAQAKATGSSAEDHLAKLSGGLKHHVQGKDPRVDACMLNTRHAVKMSEAAHREDTPDAHIGSAQFHRLSAEAHRAQATRPWTKGEGAHHVGLAILHEQLADHHDKKAAAAHKRIQAELRRKREMEKRMEMAEKGREARKAHDEGGKWVMGLDEAVAEHEELVNTLESPSRQDDKEELAEQGEELERMREAKKGLETCGAGTDLSTLKGGGAIRAESIDKDEQDASRTIQKANPTEAQIKAGNYKKEHHRVHGLDISIENPIGSTRSGVAKDGTKWETTMTHHYGYIKRTEGADGDHVDCFLGPDLDNPYVHIINQVEPTTGKFDEHKCMIGFHSREAAIKGYHDNYQKGWKGCSEVKTMHVEDFKEWLKHGDQQSRLIYKAACTRLHTVSRLQMNLLRHRPGTGTGTFFTDAVAAAKGVGVSDDDIIRTVKNATGTFEPLLRHLRENK